MSVFYFQYQCKWLPGKTHLWNDLLCVEWDVKPYSLTHSLVGMVTQGISAVDFYRLYILPVTQQTALKRLLAVDDAQTLIYCQHHLTWSIQLTESNTRDSRSWYFVLNYVATVIHFVQGVQFILYVYMCTVNILQLHVSCCAVCLCVCVIRWSQDVVNRYLW